MTYQEYMQAAKGCTTPDEAEKLINMVADDYTITARQYCNIRYVAINTAYNN